MAFVVAWLGGSGVIFGAAFRTYLPGGWWAVLGVLLLAVLPVWQLTQGWRCRCYPSKAMRLWALRPFWYAMLGMPLIAAGITLGALVGWPFDAAGEAGRWTFAVSGPALLFVAVVGYFDSRRLTLRRLTVHLPRLPPAFDGLRIAQISDLHVGPHTRRAFLRQVAEQVMGESPDLIAITGDQVDDFSRDVEHFNTAFGGLGAPLGVYAIPGNHDVYAGWSAVAQGLREAGFTVLVNAAVSLERRGQRLWVAGTGDPAGSGSPLGADPVVAPDITRTLAAVPADDCVLVLAHNPGLWPRLSARGADLTLSGHTHYGQFVWPWRAWCLASPFLRYAMGAHRDGDSLLYINPGTNYWGLPLRFRTPPEVTLLTLRATPEDEPSIVGLVN